MQRTAAAPTFGTPLGLEDDLTEYTEPELSTSLSASEEASEGEPPCVIFKYVTL